MKNLYDYYQTRQFLPTFAGLEDEAALDRYAEMRERVLRDCLALPKRVFNGANVLDYGPDTGEDALVFARWGARLTLVEPNAGAHPAIQTYFKRFKLDDRLERLVKDDVLGYRDEQHYDFIVAEGFIWTIHPPTAWLEVFHRQLSSDGMFLITYYEAFGGFIELCLRALHAAQRRRSGLDAVTTARGLYGAKWDSIPHTRAFESWVLDVLENPFLRARNMLVASRIVRDFAECGFALYSSFPSYRDGMAIGWHKRAVSAQDQLEGTIAHVERSALSFLLGTKLYLVCQDDVAGARDEATALLQDVDALIDADDPQVYRRIVRGLGALASRLGDAELVVDAGGREKAIATLRTLARAFELAASAQDDQLVRHTATDADFISAWGIPNHLAVGRVLATA